jgi:hypothetical protein
MLGYRVNNPPQSCLFQCLAAQFTAIGNAHTKSTPGMGLWYTMLALRGRGPFSTHAFSVLDSGALWPDGEWIGSIGKTLQKCRRKLSL